TRQPARAPEDTARERQDWASLARQAGVGANDLFTKAAEIHQAEADHQDRIAEMLAEARRPHRCYNASSKPTTTRGAFRTGALTALPHFDEVPATLAGQYPELLGQEDTTQRLFELLARGKPPVPRLGDFYAQALDTLKRQRRLVGLGEIPE